MYFHYVTTYLSKSIDIDIVINIINYLIIVFTKNDDKYFKTKFSQKKTFSDSMQFYFISLIK